MSGLDIFALIVLTVIVGSLVYVFILLGAMPGKIARQRNHPQAEAIAIGSWVGLILGGVFWAVFLVWAYIVPRQSQASLAEDQSEKIASLEARLAALEARLEPSAGGQA